MDILIIGILIVFLIGIVIAFYIGAKVGSWKKHREWENQVPELRADAVEKSRAVLGGQFSEQLAPFLPGFRYIPTECRFIGKPVDFIVFKGMNEKNIGEVIFLEVKSGDSKLNESQKKLKQAVESGNVRWEEYRIPKELTRKKDI